MMFAGGSHTPHRGQLINISDLMQSPALYTNVIMYEGGTNVWGGDDAHDRYASDAPGIGRDQPGGFGLSGSFQRAKQLATAQTRDFISWSKRNMTCSCRNIIFPS